MPYTYTRDDQRRRIVESVSYGVLYDVRGLTGQPTVGDLKHFMDAETLPAAGKQPFQLRGPMVFLVTEPALYEKACTYRALGRGKLTIEVFRDFDEADAWLKTKAIS